jgi:hypothetical protein
LMRQAAFARFGNERPIERLEWLSDNGAVYTALKTVIEAEKLGLTPITTPVASPESNGMSEAFVNTLRRDYLDGAAVECRDLAVAGGGLDQRLQRARAALGARISEPDRPPRRTEVKSGQRVSHEIGVRAISPSRRALRRPVFASVVSSLPHPPQARLQAQEARFER